MRDWLKRAVFAACLGMLSLLIADSACAASLGKIEVASHIGEPFYAEVPLALDADELISQVFVQIADKGDYRIFEVYRDPVLSTIRADLVSDKRGARVQLSSRTTVSTPYFNLVLKIRTGRVSYFRKYPVFLDAGKAIQAAASKKPQPSVEAVSVITNDAATKPATNTSGQIVAPATPPVPAPAQDDNWARTGKYGPIVRGDSLSTIARRLRVDHRYSLNQTMVALFDKNQDSFDKQNMNLLKAGSVLKVPSAAEVETHSKQEALNIMRQHQQAWKKLTEQPHYAAVAEAQRTRYAPRVSVGKQADVEAMPAPVATTQAQAESKSAAAPVAAESTPSEPTVTQPGEGQAAAPAEQTTQSAESNTVLAETNKLLASMQQKNEQLQEQLGQNSQTMKALQEKIDTLAIESSKARIDKLEVLIARLQDQQEKERRQQASVGQVAATADWIVWLLTALVLVLIAVVVVLLRREPAHPGASVNLDVEQPVSASVSAPVEPAKAVPPAVAETAPSASDELADTIESEVSEIEADTDKAHQGSDNLVDALSDTATAELEPFDATARALDPEVDYVSEADVYIRYGMYEEALQQLDMALRLQPDNVQAHIKKAEILLSKSDAKGFDETIAVATMALAPTDLARFRASVTELGGDVDEKAPLVADEESVIGEAAHSGDTLQIDEEDLDELNFKLTDFENDKAKNEEASQPEEQNDQAAGELDWLFDDAFDNEEASADTSHEAASADHAATVEPVGGDQEAGATQELDSLLQEFSDDRSVEATGQQGLPSQSETAATQPDSMQQTGEVGSTDAEMGATMRLDQLFGEFYGDDDEEPTDFESHAAETGKPAGKRPVATDSEEDLTDSNNDDASATTRLDQLLGEFDNDDDFINFDDDGELSGSVFDVSAKDRSLSSSATDIDHGATQELDSLLGAFTNNDDENSHASDELDASFFESGEADRQDDMDAFDIDHGATQELDVLLGAFADDDASFNMEEDTDSQGIDSIDKARREDDGDISDEGATQVLGHLLDEFTKPDKDEKKS